PLAGGKGCPRVDHDDREARQRGHARQRLRDVHRSHQNHAQRRIPHLQEHRSRVGVHGFAAVFSQRTPDCVRKGACVVGMSQRLLAGRKPGQEHDRPLGRPLAAQLFEQPKLHSSASTNTSTCPPQASPTSHAISWVPRSLSGRGGPPLMPASASWITAPSMHPPETEPQNSPASLTESLLPGGRGDEPQVLTTVASATARPAVFHATACASTSSTSLVMAASSAWWYEC